jgi:hypothetical protein
MATSRDYPTPHPEMPAGVIPPHHPSRLRVLTAVALLTAMGLLAAASVFASRPYQPPPGPAPGTRMVDIPAGHGAPHRAQADPC